MSLHNSRIASRYIFFEMLPSFIMGILVFIFILLMFQALRLTEFALVHGVSIQTIAQMMGYMAIGFLPVLFPMSLMFAVLMSYGRMSNDSEIVAFKSIGLSQTALTFPAIIIGILISILSAQTSFNIAPWGNRQFEVLFSHISQTKAGASIREGTFSEGFFDMIIYANEVDSESGKLKKVFIYDERDKTQPITIIAREGQIIQDKVNLKNQALLQLKSGDIHRKSETHTKIHFNGYDIKLGDDKEIKEREKSPQSLTLNEISYNLKNTEMKQKERLGLETEYHKRWAISVACFIFALVGVGFGTQTNRRNAKSGALILSILLIVCYWILYVTAEGMARGGKIQPALAIWFPNLIYFLISLWSLKKASN